MDYFPVFYVEQVKPSRKIFAREHCVSVIAGLLTAYQGIDVRSNDYHVHDQDLNLSWKVGSDDIPKSNSIIAYLKSTYHQKHF